MYLYQYETKEEIQAQKGLRKMVRLLGLPSGGGAVCEAAIYRWQKRGGYADKTVARVHVAAKEAGFTVVNDLHSGSPDGNYVGSGTLYRAPGWELRVKSSYGVVAADNSFMIELRRR